MSCKCLRETLLPDSFFRFLHNQDLMRKSLLADVIYDSLDSDEPDDGGKKQQMKKVR